LTQEGFSVPDAEALQKIADVLEVDVKQLLGTGVETEKSNNNALVEQLARINEQLPEWSDEVWITYDTSPKESAIEQSVTLEIGETKELSFSLQDGRDATCYINRVCLTDVWAEKEKRFADPAYRERMLQHVSEEQLDFQAF